MIKLDNILIPTDFSDYSRPAAEYACALAKQLGGKIHVVHVFESPIMAMLSPDDPFPETLLADMEGNANKKLHAWYFPELEQIADVTRALIHGSPFVEILRYSRDNNIDLIVLGTHGRSGLMHVLIGSVAEKIVRKASCPVLTVRPHGYQFVMP